MALDLAKNCHFSPFSNLQTCVAQNSKTVWPTFMKPRRMLLGGVMKLCTWGLFAAVLTKGRVMALVLAKSCNAAYKDIGGRVQALTFSYMHRF